MRVLLCHTFYQQPGGEDQSFRDEAEMLRAHGHEVFEYTRHNDDVERHSRLKVAVDTVWCRSAYRELRAKIRECRPDLLHCTNIFPILSPSVYQAARDEGVRVVQALRNYRLLCPSGTLMRDGAVCEQCVGKRLALPAIRHACYRESRMATSVVAAMLGVHHLRGTWEHSVDRFYTPSRFAREVFVRAGMPADKIDTKPNCVRNDPGMGDGSGGFALFVGRLAPEKGVATLLDAWRRLPDPIELRIIGRGACGDLVQEAADADPRIVWLGEKPLDEVYRQMRLAACLIMPSVWYETFGRTIVEAYAAGTPVIASDMGAMRELLVPGQTGLLAEPGSAESLAGSVQELLARGDLPTVRRRCREEFENRYTLEKSYQSLIAIYEKTLGGPSPAPPRAEPLAAEADDYIPIPIATVS